MVSKRHNGKLWGIDGMVLLLIGVAFLVLNLLTGLFGDDFALSFVFEKTYVDLSRPVRTLGDVLHSQYNHYLSQHGRILDIGLDQWFFSLGNKHYFDVFNTLLFVGFIFLLQKLTGRRGCVYSIVTVTILFVFTRAFGEVFLWQTGSLNYLLGGFMNVLFLYLLKRNINNNSYWQGAALLLLSIIAGWIQESFSIGIAAALVCGITWQLLQKKEISVAMVLMAIGYIVGTLIIILSPGAWNRAAHSGINSASILTRLGTSVIYVLLGLRIFWLMVVVACIAMRRQGINIKVFLYENAFILLAIGFEILFLFMVGNAAEPRAFFGVETLSLILLLKYFPWYSKTFAVIITAVLIAIYSWVFIITLRNYKTTQAFLTELHSSSSDGVVFFDGPHYSNLQKHYLGAPLRASYRSHILFFEAAYYGKERLMILPTRCKKELYETSALTIPANRCGKNKYTIPELDFTITPLPGDKPLPHSSKGLEYVSFPSGNYILCEKDNRHR